MVDLRQRRATRRCVRRDAAVGKLILACLSWGFSTALTKIVLDRPRLPWPSCSCENESTFHS
jgi:hypothetical protein